MLSIQSMPNQTVISRYDRDRGSIETLEPTDGGELYYRSCIDGCCRYSSDLWQAELHLDQMLRDDPA